VDAAPEQAVVHSGAGGKAADRRGPATLRPWAEPPPGPQETSVLNHVTLVGNLTADPELRATAGGTLRATFRVAVTPRYRDADGWRDGDPSFHTVVCWRQLADHVAASVGKGDRVVVVGRWRQRQYEVDGTSRTAHEVDADAVGVDLGRYPVTVRRGVRIPAETAAPEPGASPWEARPPAPGGTAAVAPQPAPEPEPVGAAAAG
jgi:single-strand DNA-binding protein